MRSVSSYRQFDRQLRAGRATHIFCLGFEDRCLAYPRLLAKSKAPGHAHTLLCVVPPDGGVGGELQRQRAEHRSQINTTLPAASLESLDDVIKRVKDGPTPMSFYVDISAMPRHAILTVLSTIVDKANQDTQLFIIHTDPRSYHHGSLQTPCPEMVPFFDAPLPERGMRVRTLMFPGFDLPYALVALTYVSASTGTDCDTKWFFSFPGRKYAFYQRARETHAYLVGKSEIGLYPQHHIALSMERLKAELSSPEATLLVSLGPRITCVSILLATLWARANTKTVNILLPRTAKYTSLRSSGQAEPMVEDVSVALQTCRAV